MKIKYIIRKGNSIPFTEEDRELQNKLTEGAVYEHDYKHIDKRSIAQNRLIHQVCKNISDELGKQNISLNSVLKHDTPCSMLAVKELMFKSVVMSLYGKDSTTKLNKDELDLVFNTLILALGSKGLDTKNILDKKD